MRFSAFVFILSLIGCADGLRGVHNYDVGLTAHDNALPDNFTDTDQVPDFNSDPRAPETLQPTTTTTSETLSTEIRQIQIDNGVLEVQIKKPSGELQTAHFTLPKFQANQKQVDVSKLISTDVPDLHLDGNFSKTSDGRVQGDLKLSQTSSELTKPVQTAQILTQSFEAKADWHIDQPEASTQTGHDVEEAKKLQTVQVHTFTVRSDDRNDKQTGRSFYQNDFYADANHADADSEPALRMTGEQKRTGTGDDVTYDAHPTGTNQPKEALVLGVTKTDQTVAVTYGSDPKDSSTGVVFVHYPNENLPVPPVPPAPPTQQAQNKEALPVPPIPTNPPPSQQAQNKEALPVPPIPTNPPPSQQAQNKEALPVPPIPTNPPPSQQAQNKEALPVPPIPTPPLPHIVHGTGENTIFKPTADAAIQAELAQLDENYNVKGVQDILTGMKNSTKPTVEGHNIRSFLQTAIDVVDPLEEIYSKRHVAVQSVLTTLNESGFLLVTHRNKTEIALFEMLPNPFSSSSGPFGINYIPPTDGYAKNVNLRMYPNSAGLMPDRRDERLYVLSGGCGNANYMSYLKSKFPNDATFKWLAYFQGPHKLLVQNGKLPPGVKPLIVTLDKLGTISDIHYRDLVDKGVFSAEMMDYVNRMLAYYFASENLALIGLNKPDRSRFPIPVDKLAPQQPMQDSSCEETWQKFKPVLTAAAQQIPQS